MKKFLRFLPSFFVVFALVAVTAKTQLVVSQAQEEYNVGVNAKVVQPTQTPIPTPPPATVTPFLIENRFSIDISNRTLYLGALLVGGWITVTLIKKLKFKPEERPRTERL